MANDLTMPSATRHPEHSISYPARQQYSVTNVPNEYTAAAHLDRIGGPVLEGWNNEQQ